MFNRNDIYDVSYISKKSREQINIEWNKYAFSDKVLTAKRYDEAVILPSNGWDDEFHLLGGVLDSQGNFIDNSGYVEGGSKPYEVCDIEQIDDIYIYIGCFHLCWGHAITDNLSKLWFLNTHECKILLSNGAKIVYITGNNMSLPSWHKELFELANVELSTIHHVIKPIRCESVIIPDNSFFRFDGSIKYSKEFKNIIDTIKSNAYLYFPPIEKLYLTRSCIVDSREWGNEKEIEEIFKNNGFVIVSPEKHSVREQISMFMNCKQLAAEEGSCSHNAIFCNNKTNVIVLRKANYVNKFTVVIGKMVGLKTLYIDCNATFTVFSNVPMVGPFYTCVTSFLRAYFNLEGFYKPFYLKLSFWKYFVQVPLRIKLRNVKNKLKLKL